MSSVWILSASLWSRISISVKYVNKRMKLYFAISSFQTWNFHRVVYFTINFTLNRTMRSNLKIYISLHTLQTVWNCFLFEKILECYSACCRLEKWLAQYSGDLLCNLCEKKLRNTLNRQIHWHESNEEVALHSPANRSCELWQRFASDLRVRIGPLHLQCLRL